MGLNILYFPLCKWFVNTKFRKYFYQFSLNNLNLIVFFFIFCLSFSNCRNKTNSNASKIVFRYNEAAGISSLDPAFARDQARIWAVNQLFNGLVQLDNQLNIQPCIAKRWEIVENGLKYIFYLRDDVYFHPHPIFSNGEGHGRRVVAQDFVYSFNRLVSSQVASPGAWIFANVERIKNTDTLNIIAINDTTLCIRLIKSFPPFLGILSMQYCSVIPREIVEHYGVEFRKHPVGTGPFMFKMWKEGVKLVMVKNPAYFEQKGLDKLPYLDAVAITFIVDKQTAFLEFIKGNIDFISGIDPAYKDELLTPLGTLNPKYADNIKLYTQPFLNTEYLGFLMDTNAACVKGSPLQDVRIRKAINYGFDRVSMMKYLRNNLGTPGLYGFIPVGLKGSCCSGSVGYSYNPTLAKQLLSEAGYPEGKGLPEISLKTNASYLDLCEYIQHQLAEIGIRLKIDVGPPATLREQMATSKINFFRGSWIADYPDAENYLSLFYSNNFSPNGPNYTHFYDKQIDELYNKSQQCYNDSLRWEYYQQMDSIIMKQSPVIVLYYDQVFRFAHQNIKGIEGNPLNLLNLKYVKKEYLCK